MHKNALTFLRCDLYEVEDILRRLIILVEKNLTLYVLPEEGQVHYSETFPLVLNLFA